MRASECIRPGHVIEDRPVLRLIHKESWPGGKYLAPPLACIAAIIWLTIVGFLANALNEVGGSTRKRITSSDRADNVPEP
jgi:hypothetical protein